MNFPHRVDPMGRCLFSRQAMVKRHDPDFNSVLRQLSLKFLRYSLSRKQQ